MTRYADPQRCPDCRTSIGARAAACPTCGLSLRGDLAHRLYTTLATADQLLVALRAVPAVAAPASPTPTPGPLPSYPVGGGRPPRRRGARGATVPQVLLGLGAVCLLVAAVVFLAVTWSALGVGGRTATLVVLTVVGGVVAAWSATRGLRAAAEALALVALGLVVLDLVGADRAGWFGSLSDPGLLLLVGGSLTLAASGAALLARARTSVELTGSELAAGCGAGLVSLGLATGDWLPASLALVAATLAPGVLWAAARRAQLTGSSVLAGLVTGLAWCTLAAYGLGRVLAHDADWRTLWAPPEAWPALLAALLVAAPARSRTLGRRTRVGLLALAQVLVVASALAPVRHLDDTRVAAGGLLVLVLGSAATVLLPRAWAGVNALSLLVAGTGAVLLVVGSTATAVARVARLVSGPRGGGAADRLPGMVGLPEPWLVPAATLALLGCLAAVAVVRSDRADPPADDREGTALRLPHPGRRGLVEGVALATGGSLLVALALYPVPLWLVVAGLLGATAGFLLRWLSPQGPVALAGATGPLAAALVVSVQADLLGVVSFTVLVAASVLVQLQAQARGVARIAGVTLGLAVAGWVWTCAEATGLPPSWAALLGLLGLGALALVVPAAPPSWWREGGSARNGIEQGCALAALLLAVAGVRHAPVSEVSSWTAVYLTVAGAVVTATALLRGGRRHLGWVGGLLLAAATWVRLLDLGVHAPEAYTLPSAAALLLVGLSRLPHDPGARTTRVLAPGICLALVPSLLWVLADPTGPRALLLGLGCLVLVLVGARLGWAAPLAAGTCVGLVVVLRLATPYVGDALPRWVLIGVSGLLLVALGVTWELRISQARAVAGYLRALR